MVAALSASRLKQQVREKTKRCHGRRWLAHGRRGLRLVPRSQHLVPCRMPQHAAQLVTVKQNISRSRTAAAACCGTWKGGGQLLEGVGGKGEHNWRGPWRNMRLPAGMTISIIAAGVTLCLNCAGELVPAVLVILHAGYCTPSLALFRGYVEIVRAAYVNSGRGVRVLGYVNALFVSLAQLTDD